MSLQDKLISTLQYLQKEGSNIQTEIHDLTNLSDLQLLIAKFELWNETVTNLLDTAFVKKQFYKMFSGVNYLGNVYVDPKSFQALRDGLNYELSQKLNYLGIAIDAARSSKSMDLLPFTESNKINQENKNVIMKKIFISHANLDDRKIRPLLTLIEDIGVPPESIFYSSHSAYGVDLGQNIFDRLKTELSGNDVFALFIGRRL